MKRSVVLALIICLFTFSSMVLAETVELEIIGFEGGWGTSIIRQAADEYEALHPNVKIKVISTTDPDSIIRPRLAAGNPPDAACIPSRMDKWGLAAAGHLHPLNEVLETKAYGQDISWGDTFVAGTFDQNSLHGNVYFIPDKYYAWVLWYNAGLFEEHGWEVPETWDEFLELCAEIKELGIAPLTTTGRYTYYAREGLLLPLIERIGGTEAMERMMRLEPGAFNNEVVIKAASMYRELIDLGYMQQGFTGMDHTTSQMEFISGRAAMIPVATWFENEMADMLTDDFKFMPMVIPAVEGGAGSGDSILVSLIGDWCVFSNSKNKDVAADFIKYMTSLDYSRKIAEQMKTLSPIKGAEDVISSEPLRAVAALVDNASVTFHQHVFLWYGPLKDESENALAALNTGAITPEQFAERLEMAAQKVREDDSIIKRY